MELFTFIPYFLLLEREESDRNTLANANTEFIREVYELQRVEKDVTLVFFQLQYLRCKLVILREHYRTGSFISAVPPSLRHVCRLQRVIPRSAGRQRSSA